VPYQLVCEQVDVRLTPSTVEILFKNRRVASHKRSYLRGGFITLTQHMPKSHQRHLEWTPSRILKWADKNGPNTRELVNQIMQSRPHPEQGFRSALGIMRLTQSYGPERVEMACSRALAIQAYAYKSVKSILKNGLDKQPLIFEKPADCPASVHHNIRGKNYYEQKEVDHAS
jgi:transposase